MLSASNAIGDGAIAGGRILGFVLSRHAAGEAEVLSIAVAKPERGKGIGNALVKAALTYATGLGFRRVYLYTSGTLPPYYRSLGWTALEKVEYLGKKRTIMAFDPV